MTTSKKPFLFRRSVFSRDSRVSAEASSNSLLLLISINFVTFVNDEKDAGDDSIIFLFGHVNIVGTTYAIRRQKNHSKVAFSGREVIAETYFDIST